MNMVKIKVGNELALPWREAAAAAGIPPERVRRAMWHNGTLRYWSNGRGGRTYVLPSDVRRLLDRAPVEHKPRAEA
jgi:hypothetical protein